ncbi:hypothetical protein WN51_12568 [Melipona quadrifasciata]|uniref:Uncharacterized protein n=1 Tax=Melipona quadrifasciata TaxID=166423 RepID=A0A0M9A277_9HYME|nr:hypothetical protein WN51_12568 [Melipona quadrifasciata]
MHQTSPKCNIKLCSNNDVPPSSVIRSCLGPSLAQVFFDYIHHDTIKLLDVLTPLKTSKACFSIPSDRQLSECRFIPPTDRQIVKAFVHQNILEIGEALLERVKKDIEESLRDKIERQSREKFYLYQAKKRREAELHVQQLHEKYENYIETTQHELQKQLEAEWSKAAAECAKNTQKAVVQERINVTNEMMRKMRAEMTHVVQSLYKDFEELFCAKRDNIIADFNQIMRFTFSHRRQFEMQNAADLINVLCLERLRNNREKHIMHKYFQQQINEFYELMVRLKDVIIAMRKEITDCHIEKKLLNEEFCEVAKHFQKFIDFVFRAMPRQADYLLPLELQRLIRPDKDKEEMKKIIE